MKNEFSEKTRKLFDRGGYMVSGESGKNNADCLHHILGRCSNSAFNAIPLNNKDEHQPEGRKGLDSIHSFSVRSKYLIKTKRFLDSIGHFYTKDDIEFLEKNKKYYEDTGEEAGNGSFPL